MNEKLKDYLSKRGAIPIDTNVIESYVNTMKESTVPQIIKDIKKKGTTCGRVAFCANSDSTAK